MIHSIVPMEKIFSEQPSDISYITKNGILMETENGKVRRIISTNPADYIENTLEM